MSDQTKKPHKQLIPRKLLFGSPDRAMPRISPDGQHLSWLAPWEGVLNVWVAPANDLAAAKPISFDKVRNVRFAVWAYTSQHVLYIQDKAGDENWHLYSVDITNGETRDLTPLEGVTAQIFKLSQHKPTEALVGLNNRVPQLHDAYRVNILTGERTLVQENPGFAGYVVDDQFVLRLALQMLPNGSIKLLQGGPDGAWSDYAEVPQIDALTTEPLEFSADGRIFYALDSRGRNTAALVAHEIASGKTTMLAEDPRADMFDVLIDPDTHQPQAASSNYERKHWQVLDPALADDFAYLGTVADGDLEILNRSQDGQQWAVAFVMDNGPVRYYLYDRAARNARFLFTNREALENVPLARMHPVVIPARDGLQLVSYYSLPVGSDTRQPGKPDTPLPMVLVVHGGPWGRDSWGYNAFHQWLANRGYAVLSVNFRASTGFGKEFTNAGDLQWGRKMHDDLLDAVDWAVREGITSANQVAIMGGSYGGYATLAGLTMTPDKFVCGVDIVGPSNLITLIESVPPYWEPMIALFRTRMGDNTTEAGRALLAERSPLTYVEQIRRPLLIAQGANDPRVKKAESDQIVNAMQAKGIPVTYALFPDEGHGFGRDENTLAFCAIAEAFLSAHLEGEVEPIGGDFAGSSLQILTGIEAVPGAAEKLA